jgi:UDP:flavonoid glycosyltransferase YjiC (YdhE family)
MFSRSIFEGATHVRIAFSSSPFLGHLFPLLPLARAARAAGHDVAVMTSEPLRPALDPGTDLLAAGPMPDVLLAEVTRRRGSDPTRDNRPEIVAELFAGARVDLGLNCAVAAAQCWCPDLIVFEYCDFIGPLVAAALGVPSARLAYGRAYRPEYEAAMTATVAPRYEAGGLSAVTPLAFLDTCPPSLQTPEWPRPQGHLYLRPEPHSLPGAEWTPPGFGSRSDLPTVLVTFGTVFHAAPVLSMVLRSLAARPVNLIVTVGPLGDPGAIDIDVESIHVERFIPLDLLLPSVSAVVSHGGGGTILAALARGLPLVLLPQGADQFHNSERVESTGAGVTLPPHDVTPATLGAAIDKALGDPVLRAGARRIAAEIAAMDSPGEVVRGLSQQVVSSLAVAA